MSSSVSARDCSLVSAPMAAPMLMLHGALLFFVFVVVNLAPALGDDGARPIIIGLDADMSSGGAQSGEAIRRGTLVALHEINAAGGVLGRPLRLVVKDHRGNPARGVDNIEALADVDNLVAVMGGSHTPVALAELDAIHKHELIYLGPWAAGTSIVANGRNPNFVFRVSVRDEHAGGFIIAAARRRGFKRPGLLLWQTGWGRSNEKAMMAAARTLGMTDLPIEWFNSGEEDLSGQIEALAASGADAILLVSNVTEGISFVRNLARMPKPKRLPVISHWGITIGDFFGTAPDAIAKVDLSFLQTFSFLDPPFPERARVLYEGYCKLFGPCTSVTDIGSPVGVAHAYDLIHLLRHAIEKTGSVDRRAVRDAMENIPSHKGVMRDYVRPFSATRHDALDATDFRVSRFNSAGVIVPVYAP